MPLAAGSPAPDFTLKTKTAEGLEDVTLSSHFHKDVVVLLFFPAVFTNVCTHEMCHANDEIPSLQDAVVYGISIDLPYAQEGWAQAHNIKVPLLSDSLHTVTEAYDAVWANFNGLGPVSARASFVIGRDGVIHYSEQTATLGDLPDFTKLQIAVEAAVAA